MYKNHNMSQITLPLNIEVLIPENDIHHYVNSNKTLNVSK